MTFLAEGKDTGGSFALLEVLTKPGNEPPPHVHEREDELLYVVDGEVEVHVGTDVFQAGPGECIFLPKRKPHAWSIRSPRLCFIALIQPAGFEQYFRAMGGVPAKKLALPEGAAAYATGDPARATQVAADFGVRFLSPEEIAEVLPHFAGFAFAKTPSQA